MTTFFNSTSFLAVYFCTYILVMIFMSVIGGKRIKLEHESYQCLKNIKTLLTKIQIALNLVQAKRDIVLLSKANAKYIENDVTLTRKKHRLSILPYNKVERFIDNAYETLKIEQLIDNIGNKLKNVAKKWFVEIEELDRVQNHKVSNSNCKDNENENMTEIAIENDNKRDPNNYDCNKNNIRIESNYNQCGIEQDTDLIKLIHYQLSNRGIWKNIVKSLWDLKGLIWIGASNYFDSASDVALIWEWYLIYDPGVYAKDGPNIYALWICALLTTIYYRLTSMYWVFFFSFTYNFHQSVTKLLFDDITQDLGQKYQIM